MPEKGSVTWAALASILTCGAIVIGGVWKVNTAMDERFEKLAVKMRTQDAEVKKDTLEIVAQIYARRDDVAKVTTKLEAMDDKLDDIKKAVDDRTRRR